MLLALGLRHAGVLPQLGIFRIFPNSFLVRFEELISDSVVQIQVLAIANLCVEAVLADEPTRMQTVK